MSKRLWMLTAAAVIAPLLAPAAQAGINDPDYEGFFVELDVAFVTPGNVNTPLIASAPAVGTLLDPNASGEAESVIEWMDWDGDLAGRIGFGYAWGDRGRLQVTYWSYSDESGKQGDLGSYYLLTGPNFNWFTIGPASTWGYSYYYAYAFDFTQKIEASALDLEFKRGAEVGISTTVSWGLGLRFLDFEDTVKGGYLARADPNLSGTTDLFRFPAARKVEGDGLGLSGSIGAEHAFNEVFGLFTNLRVGFVTSDVDSEHAVVDLDGYYNAFVPEFTWTQKATVEDELATTLDFEAGISVHVGERFDIEAGWTYTSWTDLPQFNLGRATMGITFAGQAGITEISGEERERIVWSGPRISGRWKF